MFDIGFSEMMVIGVVALIVIGPQKLPKVARTIGHMLGRMQRYVNDVKADINREIELDELRKFKQEFEQTASTFESAVRTEINKTEQVFTSAATGITGSPSPSPAAGGTPAPVTAAPLPTAPPPPTTPPPPVTAATGASTHGG